MESIVQLFMPLYIPTFQTLYLLLQQTAQLLQALGAHSLGGHSRRSAFEDFPEFEKLAEELSRQGTYNYPLPGYVNHNSHLSEELEGIPHGNPRYLKHPCDGFLD